MTSYNEAIQIARDAAKNIFLNFNLTAPVNVENIAQDLGIKIDSFGVGENDYKRNNLSGFIKMEDKEGKPVIMVNVNQGDERRRFTIAHEIGHFLLHKNSSLHVDTNTNGIFFRDEVSTRAVDLNEIQANQFAAELLMPTTEVREKLKMKLEEGNDLDSVSVELSKFYQVSSTAMAIKVGGLVSYL